MFAPMLAHTLIACISFSCIQIYSMEKLENYLVPASEISQELQEQALQLVMINCLKRRDFNGISHIIEKIQIRPGKTFTEALLKGPLVGMHVFGKHPTADYSYGLFKTAIQSEHLFLKIYLCKLALLPQIHLLARVRGDREIQNKVTQHPAFQEQKEKYRNKAIQLKNKLAKP